MMITVRHGLYLVAATAALLTTVACGTNSVNDGVVSDASGNLATLAPDAQPQPEPAKAPPTWGQRYTWDDGIAIEVAAPAACKPTQYASPSDVPRAVKVTVKIINGSAKAFDAALLSLGDAQFAGKKAETVFDSGGACGAGGFESATVLPGKTYTYSVAYAVDAAPGEMQLAFQPDFGSDEAVFVGPA